jgi:hypothetical protein
LLSLTFKKPSSKNSSSTKKKRKIRWLKPLNTLKIRSNKGSLRGTGQERIYRKRLKTVLKSKRKRDLQRPSLMSFGSLVIEYHSYTLTPNASKI